MSVAVATPAGFTPTFLTDASLARFSVAQYQKMIAAGALTDEDAVELLEHFVVRKMPRNPAHDGTVSLIDETLRAVLPSGWHVRVQSAIVLEDSQPEPDLTIVRGRARDYLSRHPGAGEVGLVVEVADTSLTRDRVDKARIYARAGLPTYWLVDLVNRRVEVFTAPSGPAAVPGYGSLAVYAGSEPVPLMLAGVAVASFPAADLLPELAGGSNPADG